MVEKTMSPIELAERLALLLAFFLGLAFEETYKRDEPTIPGGIRTFPLGKTAKQVGCGSSVVQRLKREMPVG